MCTLTNFIITGKCSVRIYNYTHITQCYITHSLWFQYLTGVVPLLIHWPCVNTRLKSTSVHTEASKLKQEVLIIAQTEALPPTYLAVFQLLAPAPAAPLASRAAAGPRAGEAGALLERVQDEQSTIIIE